MASVTESRNAASSCAAAAIAATGSIYTCLSCQVAYKSNDEQRDHYKTEWHKYNLKRKVAGLVCISFENFSERQKSEKAAGEKVKDYKRDHVKKDKKDKKMKRINDEKGDLTCGDEAANEKDCQGNTGGCMADGPSSMEAEEYIDENATPAEIKEIITRHRVKLTAECCLFCSFRSDSVDTSLVHMEQQHSFFIPDAKFLSDKQGLLEYLCQKLSLLQCLYCEKGFRNLSSVRKHMIDKSHCKLNYENDGDLEYVEFFSFESSKRQNTLNLDNSDGSEWEDVDESCLMDEEDLGSQGEDEGPTAIISEDGSELMLPNGTVVGHRAYRRYYKQHFGGGDEENGEFMNEGIRYGRSRLAHHNSSMDPSSCLLQIDSSNLSQPVSALNQNYPYMALAKPVSKEDRCIERSRLSLAIDQELKISSKLNSQKHFRLQYRQ